MKPAPRATSGLAGLVSVRNDDASVSENLAQATQAADDAVTSFVQRCQKMGLTPPEAFEFYQDLNLFASPMIVDKSAATDVDRRFLALKEKLGQALGRVQSADDWQAYRKHWAHLVTGADPAQAVTLEKKKVFLNEHQAWSEFFLGQAQSDLIDRLVGGSPQPAPVQAMTWESLATVVRRDRTEWASEPDVDLGETPDAEVLRQAMTATQAVGWKWINGNDATVHQRLAHNLLAAQQALQKQTQLPGPVLGLGGKLRLMLGYENKVDGLAWSNGQSRFLITAPDAGWGVLAHEWLHLFDFSMAELYDRSNNTLSNRWSPEAPLDEHQDSVPKATLARAYNALLSSVHDGNPLSKTDTSDLDYARATWAERLKRTYPEERHQMNAWIEAEASRLADGSWDVDVSYQGWHEAIQRTNPDSDANHLRAWMVIHEIDLLFRQRAQTSTWLQYLSGINETWRQHDAPEDWLGYFLRPEEVLAHSFETMFPKQETLIVDAHVGELSMRYPLPNEGAWQAQAWAQFFETVRPVWCDAMGLENIAAPSALEAQPQDPKSSFQPHSLSSLAERLSKSLAAQKNAPLVAPSSVNRPTPKRLA